MTQLHASFALAAALLFSGSVTSPEPRVQPVKAPPVIELRDQYDAPATLSFPATNIVLLAIADQQGSKQVDGWIAALKPRYTGRVSFRGLADVGGAPGFLRGKIRRKFQATRTYPVMMDWSGKVCAQFAYQPGVANLLVLRRDGTIAARFTGAAGETQLRSAFVALDGALAHEPEFPQIGR